MTRAGREPAEDLKRRLAAACREVGLEVTKAQTRLMREHRARFVVVCASLPGWRHEIPMVTDQTWVKTTGEISPVEVFCQATDVEEDPLTSTFTKPLMHGRKILAVDSVVAELHP